MELWGAEVGEMRKNKCGRGSEGKCGESEDSGKYIRKKLGKGREAKFEVCGGKVVVDMVHRGSRGI